MHTLTATVKVYHRSETVTAVGLGIRKPDGDFAIVKAVAFGPVADALAALADGQVVSVDVDFSSSPRTIERDKKIEVEKGRGKNKKTVLETVKEQKTVEVPGFKVVRFNKLIAESEVIVTPNSKEVRVPRVPSNPLRVVGRLGNAGRYDAKSDKTFTRLVVNQRYQDRNRQWVEKAVWMTVVLEGNQSVPDKALVQLTAQPHSYEGALELHASSLLALEERRAA